MSKFVESIKYKKWNHRNISIRVAILYQPNKNRLVEKISSLNLDVSSLTEIDYKTKCLEKFVIDYTGISDIIYKNCKSKSDFISYKNSLFKVVSQVNPLVSPENLYLSSSNTLTFKKTGFPLVGVESWRKREDAFEINKLVVIQAVEKADYASFDLIVERWDQMDRTIFIRQFTDPNPENLFIGFDPKDAYERKTYVIGLCVDNLLTILRDFRENKILLNLDHKKLIDRLYSFVVTHNQWADLKLKDIRKINKEYQNGDPRREIHSEPSITDSELYYNESNQHSQKKTKSKVTGSYYSLSSVPVSVIRGLPSVVKNYVYGQDTNIDKICEVITKAYIGGKDKEKPIGCFLLYGGTSVGKTEVAKVISQNLTNCKDGLLKIDCNTYQQDHDISSLIGSAAGYVGYEEGGILPNAIQENPFRVILFDEVEKATPKLFDFILNILDEGQTLDKKGNKVDFRDCIIFMTSNIGQREADNAIVGKIGFGTPSIEDEESIRNKEFNRILRKNFKPEFISRIKVRGGILYFPPLSKEDLKRVAKKEISSAVENLGEYNNLKCFLKEEILDNLIENLFKSNHNIHSRDVITEVNKIIINPIIELLLKNNALENREKRKAIAVSISNNDIKLKYREAR